MGCMERVDFDEAETHEPDEGWQRRALAGSERFSFEWFEKPPGHSSPTHSHENEQVCLCLSGELTVHAEERSVVLGAYDSVHLGADEPHRVENESDERAVGLDVFAPGRSFDFWTDRTGDDGAE